MADSHSGQHATYSFLVHSSSSPDASVRFDSSTNHKQKRRRTSPHDHHILEAAYQRNSKPDKKERADIVSQVDLGEKEVQIWFQNRRQNDRRKSKPLQPHELIAHLRNGIQPETSPPMYESTTMSTACSANHSSHVVATTTSTASVPSAAAAAASNIHDLLNPSSSSSSMSTTAQSVESKVSRTPTTVCASVQTETPPSSFDASHPNVASQGSQSSTSSASVSRTFGHGRKRSHEVMAESKSAKSNSAITSDQITLAPLQRSSSFVRLAMTVDGAVKVRTNNEPTPSPPKQRLPPPEISERRNSPLMRSQSDMRGTIEFKDVNPPIRRAGTAGFGRSRDVRTWEFYCDRDSGDALETQAEAERNGSAIGAINLIRSSSQRAKARALSPNLAKQNIRRVPSDLYKKKPQFSRARSSMARLQSYDGTNDAPDMPPKRSRHERSSSRDSDKENWAPGTRASHNPLRRMQPSMPRTSILQENDVTHRSQSTHDRSALPANENVSQEQDVQHTSSDPPVLGTPGKAKGDDLDCIQGLLSLSQGAWR